MREQPKNETGKEFKMVAIAFDEKLKEEYKYLYNDCVMKEEYAAEVKAIVDRIVSFITRYKVVGLNSRIPWAFIAVIHSMESGGRFTRHLHNGDPLSARTIHVPKGRPLKGNPPFSWEESAYDAMILRQVHKVSDWSAEGILYQIEGYNGFGYRKYHPKVLSPYLWSYSNWYTAGKYASDGTFSETLVSKQCGAAVLLKELEKRGAIRFQDISQ